MNTKLSLCLSLLLAAVAAADASDLFSAKPALLNSSESDDLIFAARLSSKAKKEWELGRPDRFVVAQYDVESTLSTKPRANTEKTSGDVRLGLRWDLDDVQAPVREFPGRGNHGSEEGVALDRSSFRWGSLSLEFATAFEGTETMSSRQWTSGFRLNYSPAFDRATSQWWMPDLWVDYRLVDEQGDAAVAQSYWRLGSALYWQFTLADFGVSDGFLQRVKIVPGFRYYRSSDARLAVGDSADAFYSSLAFDYAIPEGGSLGRYASAIRVEIADGRIPPATKSATVFSVAIAVKWKSLIR